MSEGADALPLSGYRVLELGNYIAAPTAGRLLADFGAEVVKVERPGEGDELRRWRLHEGDTSLLFHTLNRQKKSIVLDLSTDEGRRTVLQLVAQADAVLENFRPGTLERWGLGPEELRAVNPDVVISRISAFGQDGPLSDRPGFAAVAEAFGGLRALVGDPDRPPVRVGVSLGDSLAGIYAAFGIVMALLDRERRGTFSSPRHGVIDVALYEAIFSITESLLPDYGAYGIERERVGGRVEGIAPTNAYPTRDGGSVIIAANADAIYRRLMDAIGRPDLRDDPALQENAGRWQQRDRLDEAIGAWTATQDLDDALAVLEAVDVPSGRIYTAADIKRNPHYAARGMIQRLTVDNGERKVPNVPFPGVVPHWNGRAVRVASGAPALGEHTASVLREWGVAETETGRGGDDG